MIEIQLPNVIEFQANVQILGNIQLVRLRFDCLRLRFCVRFRFNYVRYSSGWQIPVKNDLNTVAEGGENEATLIRPHSLPRKTSCQPVHCRSISIKRHQISIEPIEHNRISIESKNWGNYSIEIRLRSTIEFQPFDCVRSKSINSVVESIRLR